jgi:hypothetical protein
MTTLEVILIVLAAALALALVWSLTARRRDRRLIASRDSAGGGAARPGARAGAPAFALSSA